MGPRSNSARLLLQNGDYFSGTSLCLRSAAECPSWEQLSTDVGMVMMARRRNVCAIDRPTSRREKKKEERFLFT
eukprot:scaffold301_cov243-Pinguiococcus_pyrenoidosus.AAC.73